MPGHFGDKKKKRPSKMMPQSFPKPPKAPKAPKAPKTPERTAKARTGSFPIQKRKPTGAKAMKAATLALLKKKKKK